MDSSVSQGLFTYCFFLFCSNDSSETEKKILYSQDGSGLYVMIRKKYLIFNLKIQRWRSQMFYKLAILSVHNVYLNRPETTSLSHQLVIDYKHFSIKKFDSVVI